MAKKPAAKEKAETKAGSSSGARKVIITCAVTGSVHTPTMTPHLPITPDQIAAESIAAASQKLNVSQPSISRRAR